jgi:phasin protein
MINKVLCNAKYLLTFMLQCTMWLLSGGNTSLITPPFRTRATPRAALMETTMFDKFEDLQKIGKENVDTALKSFGAVSKGVQAIAVEVADFNKKSFEEGTAALEKLLGAKTLDKAIEVQTDYFKTAYEGFVAKASKIGELYADLAKETYKPIEGAIAKQGVR